MPGGRDLRRLAGIGLGKDAALGVHSIPDQDKTPAVQSQQVAGRAAGIDPAGLDGSPVAPPVVGNGLPEPAQVGANEHQEPAIGQLGDCRLSRSVVVTVPAQIDQIASPCRLKIARERSQ